MKTSFPKLRDDLRFIEAQIINGKKYILIRDILLEGWQHLGYRVSEEAMKIVRCCDGNVSIQELPALIQERWGYRFAHEEIEGLIERFDDLHLLENDNYAKAKGKIADQLISKSVREPVCAGRGYPDECELLEQKILECFISPNGPGSIPLRNEHTVKPPVNGLIVPHGNLNVSGPCAAWGYFELATGPLPDLFVLLGPNHAYEKDSIEIQRKDFITPFGRVPVDQEFSSQLIANCEIPIDEDSLAGYREHSIEMQLPFLQYLDQSNTPKLLRIVPILLSEKRSERRAPKCKKREIWQALARSIRKAISESEKHVCIIASGDFTHYGAYHNYVPFKSDVLNRIEMLDKESIALIESGRSDDFLARASSTSYCCNYPIYVLLNAVEAIEIKLLNYYMHSAKEGDLLVNTFASMSVME